jgi:hypothetical protein
MKSVRHTCRRVFFLVSVLILLCILIGGMISMWLGISTQDEVLIVVSLIMIVCGALGGLSLLQDLIPGSNIIGKRSFLTIIFWVILGIPLCGMILLRGTISLTMLLQEIFQGKLLSLILIGRDFQQYFLDILFGLVFPLSIFAAWIKSRKLGRPMHEVWEKWLGSVGRR